MSYKPFKMKGHTLPGPNQKDPAPTKLWPSRNKAIKEGKKTSTWDKVKSAGGAFVDTMKQEWHDPAGHGSYDSLSHRMSGHYKKRKKDARKKKQNA